MKVPQSAQEFDRKDLIVALLLAALALGVYVRTLAPDILYADSAEFQTLSYKIGVTHSTGYPTYLFLGRLMGYIPLKSPAWRISLLSAVSAAITIAGIYLLTLRFTRSRVGASLGAMALGMSYTFWSQAVIAEVYTPAMAVLVAIMLLLFHWQTDPGWRARSLFAAALLAGFGFGVHASVWTVAIPAIALVLWTLASQRASRAEWLRSLSAGFIGAVVGLAIFLIAFLIADRINSPLSFIRTTLEPSRTYWGLQANDIDSPFERLKQTVVSAQWGNSLFPDDEDFSFGDEWGVFWGRVMEFEFATPALLFAILGLVVMLITRPISGLFYLFDFLVAAFLILNYRVWEKHVFYLALYIPLTVAMGAGMGFVLDRLQGLLESLPARSSQLVHLLISLFFITMIMQPASAIRWNAVRNGVADFVTEDYPFPVKNLREPRMVAQTYLAGKADNSVFLLEWRVLHATTYLAHVEKGMTDTLFFEAMPYGNDGKVAPPLVAELQDLLEEGRPIYANQVYPGLDESFRLVPSAGNLYQLSLKSE